MKKHIVLLTGVALLWCFGLGIFIYKQVDSPAITASVVMSAVVEEPKPVTVLFFGDMMLDRKVRQQIDSNGPEYPFALIKDFLKGNDEVVVNAEGPFTYNKSVTIDKIGQENAPLTFTFDPKILPTLKDLGFTVLGQANNHTLNFGAAGFLQSTYSMENIGLDWFGNPSNEDVGAKYIRVRDEVMAFVGYNEFAYKGLDKVLLAIQEAKKFAAFVVVYPHWGEEYELDHNLAQEKTARKFIDAGADVVIGAHPHVIQPVEMYKNKPIFYSLGNFIFDQSASGPTGRGLTVKVSLDKKTARYDIFPISILKQQASLMFGEEKQLQLDKIGVPSGVLTIDRGI
jgi:poly-gamma-glutamate synthesis protein (capsule biosynthesis protein)